MLKRLNWRRARWWSVINVAGMLITMISAEIEYASHVPREYNSRPDGYASVFLFQLFVLILMGLLQVAACCCLTALNSSRKKAFQVALAIFWGVLTALLIPILGSIIMYLTAVIFRLFNNYLTAWLAIFTLFGSGIIFGWLLGLSQWRREVQSAA